MADENHPIDFSTVLAAAVHDMKNSLCLLSQTIEDLGQIVSSDVPEAKQCLATAHYEASRLNTGLVQLLSLYRANTRSMPLSVDECYLEDLVEDVLDSNESYIRHRKMELKVEKQADLLWYLDRELIILLLNDVLINAMRYSQSKILLKTFAKDNYIYFQVEDDGDGYPSSMLQATSIDIQDININQGRTGLGLFFARMIAEAHTNNGRRGEIYLSNGGSLGGSVFTLKLP